MFGSLHAFVELEAGHVGPEFKSMRQETGVGKSHDSFRKELKTSFLNQLPRKISCKCHKYKAVND